MRWMIGISLLSLVMASSQSRAQTPDWVASALPDRAYDFGTVARGSQVRHAFPIINRSDSELRVIDWRTKCGCTDVRVGAKIIPPGTQTSVEATIDTTKFMGYKPSGLILIFDRPTYAEVNLNLSCFIRGDLIISPGQIDFGIVRRAEKMAQASLTLTYAGGRSDWEVTKMKTLSNKIKAELRELGRTADGQINYSLTASLQPGIPNGTFKDEITLLTSDPTSPTIPISVVASIQSAVSVTPSIINFGGLRSGQTISKTVIVRSAQPFSITKLSASEGAVEPIDLDAKARPVHQVKLTFKAPEQNGPLYALVTIETDVKDEPPAKLKTFATIVP